MKKIYSKDRLYSFLRPYVDWCCKHSYRKTEIRGQENLPTDGAVLLTPNHCNTLMDALGMLRAEKGPTVFGARADLFKKPMIAKIMHFLRILPMVRQRDGLRNVLKNHDTIGTISEVLENNIRFCMYPEGTHRPAHSLLPVGKGALRAAFAANERFGDKRPVYLMPTGIEYGDYFRFRSTCLITYGTPINITELVREMAGTHEAQAMDTIRHRLAEEMSKLITYIRYDDQYPAKWALTRFLSNKADGSLHDRMMFRRSIVKNIEKVQESRPEIAEKLLAMAEKLDEARKKAGVSSYSFGKRHPLLKTLLKSLAALLILPYFIFCLIASSPMWAAAMILKGKVRDRAFHNTVHFGVKLALTPFMIMIWAAITFCLTPWPIATVLLAAALPSYSFFYDYSEQARILISDWKLLCNNRLNKMYKEVTDLYHSL